MLNNLLKKVAVIGAAGKMGFQIATLLLQEMALTELATTGKIGSGAYYLLLIDVDQSKFFPLKKLLKKSIQKYAEKNINILREKYADNPLLISNEEIIQAFVEGALNSVYFEDDVVKAKGSHLIFEAIYESVEEKVTLFKKVKSEKGFYFTNTSSIPIQELNLQAHLENRMIGFHFYNPPEVQKLVELIPLKNEELLKIAHELVKRLNKIAVVAKDAPGFIGNGHFMRECLFAFHQADRLMKEEHFTFQDAITLVDEVTQKLLFRPMGIFQLMDYVGLDIVLNVLTIMKLPLPVALLYQTSQNVLGGQNPDGTQKKGFFSYEGHEKKEARHLPISFSWKTLSKMTNREEVIKKELQNTFRSDHLESRLAKEFLIHSLEIAENLVKENVAHSLKDVDTVLKLGFFHLYGVSLIKDLYA